MKDYVSIDVRPTTKENNKVFESVKLSLTKFSWRTGDSDALGPYISGRDADDITIQIWLGEEPYAMSVSFEGAWPDSADREIRKQDLLTMITNHVIPNFGEVIKIVA